MSLPVRGAWIEIVCSCPRFVPAASLPVRGAWIEITAEIGRQLHDGSLPVRGAWIEISPDGLEALRTPVAPRAGSVD